jgi:lysophospholipase L1-like esterase
MKRIALLAVLMAALALVRRRGVRPPQAPIVAIGDSITALAEGGPPWPAVLASLLGQPVLNRGISGNGVRAYLGSPPLIDRFARDALAVRGVHTVVILEGINDIWNGPLDGQGIAEGVVVGLATVVEQARVAGVRAVCATVLPFGSSDVWTPGREAAREGINAWIRAPGHCDVVVDTALALADPLDAGRLRADYDSGDGLHPNGPGAEAIAHAVLDRIGQG